MVPPPGPFPRRAAPLAAALALLLLGGFTGAQSRARAGALLPLEEVAVVDLDPVPFTSLRKEDRERAARGLPPRFARPLDVDLTPGNAGTWESAAPGLLAWRLRVRSPGALNLNLGFSDFHLPEGARLSVRSADGVHVVRPFTAEDNEAHGELWTPVVGTDDLVVELELPEARAEDLRLRLTRIGQGYRGFGARSASAAVSGDCNVDVACDVAADWGLEIPAVGVISSQGSLFCTGYLVNNLREDLRPYFVTAAHCGITAQDAPSLVVYWNYRSSFCREPGTPVAFGPGDGTLDDFTSGAVLRAAWGPSDVTLLELDDDPDPAFDLSWAGWDATGADALRGTVIHHPRTEEKRISFELDPTTTTSYLGTQVPGNGTHVRVAGWELGTTEPGSSGAPLFNEEHRVIGQLHGGFASCTSDVSDWYGKFSVSWTGGGTPATRLADWLDPDGTGFLVADTVNAANLCDPAARLVLDRPRYAPGAALEVELTDCDLDLDPLVRETVVLVVASESEPGGEPVRLEETGPTTGRFRGGLGLELLDAPGVLAVADGDLLSVSYFDADDGVGGAGTVLAAAEVDATPPTALSGRFSEVGPTSFTVSLVTDEPVILTVEVGSDCGVFDRARSSLEPSTNPVVTIPGLPPGVPWAVRARLENEAGLVTLDDNRGFCYGVETDPAPATYTELFLGDLDLSFRSLFFVPTGGPGGYAVCQRRVPGLPRPIAGARDLELEDDGTAVVELTGGRRVLVHGQPYERVFVSANGNVTFQSPDGDFSESLVEHFGQARLSVLWEDLNPAQGGAVLAEELGDRLVVTWDRVPRLDQGDENSFQLELFYDGTLRMTWAELGASDGLVGISAGLGLPPGFVESDLSSVYGCPRLRLRSERPVR